MIIVIFQEKKNHKHEKTIIDVNNHTRVKLENKTREERINYCHTLLKQLSVT